MMRFLRDVVSSDGPLTGTGTGLTGVGNGGGQSAGAGTLAGAAEGGQGARLGPGTRAGDAAGDGAGTLARAVLARAASSTMSLTRHYSSSTRRIFVPRRVIDSG